MSWYKTEGARWVHDLFSKLELYRHLYYSSYISLGHAGFTYDQTRDLLASLLKIGARLANCEAVNENVFRCNNAYIGIATPPSSYCGDTSNVGFEFTWFHIFACLNKIVLNVRDQQVVLSRILYEGRREDGMLSIFVDLYLLKVKKSTGFFVFVSPGEMFYHFGSPEAERALEKAGLTPHEILSIFFKDKSAKASVEDGIRRILNILPKVLTPVAAYLLY